MARHVLVALVALVALPSLVACSKAPPPPPQVRAVRVVEVRAASSEPARRYSGSLEPRERVELAFRVAGRVRTIADASDPGARRPLQEGDAVRRGQVLATLDERDLALSADSAQATAAVAEADVATAQAALGQSESEAVRARGLAATGTIPAAELERVESSLAAAKARLAAARGQLGARTGQAALARRTTEDTRLVSPIDGVVARRSVGVGEAAGPSRVAFVIIDASEMRLAFAAPDVRVRDIRLGARVPVRVEALPEVALTGVVSKIDPVADPVTHTFRIELTTPNEQRLLRAGMVATALPGVADGVAITVPLASVVRRPEARGFAVFTLGPEAGKVKATEVDLGDLVGNDVEVLRGLSVGEKVVTEGAALLRAGEAVEVLP